MDNSFKETEYQLYNFKDLDTFINIADIKIKILEDDISSKSISYEEKSTPTNAFHSDVETEVIRRELHNSQKIEKLKLEKQSRLRTKELIETSLNVLDPTEKRLVEHRYFSKPKKSWKSISLEMNMSEESCLKLRRVVISKLSKLINI